MLGVEWGTATTLSIAKYLSTSTISAVLRATGGQEFHRRYTKEIIMNQRGNGRAQRIGDIVGQGAPIVAAGLHIQVVVPRAGEVRGQQVKRPGAFDPREAGIPVEDYIRGRDHAGLITAGCMDRGGDVIKIAPTKAAVTGRNSVPIGVIIKIVKGQRRQSHLDRKLAGLFRMESQIAKHQVGRVKSQGQAVHGCVESHGNIGLAMACQKTAGGKETESNAEGSVADHERAADPLLVK